MSGKHTTFCTMTLISTLSGLSSKPTVLSCPFWSLCCLPQCNTGFFLLAFCYKMSSWAVGNFFQPQGRTVFFSVKLLGLYKGRYTSVQSVQSLSPVWFCDPMNRSRKVHVVLVYSCSINCLHLVAFWTRMLLAFPAISVLWPIPLILPILLVRITAQLLGVWKAVGSVKVGTLPLCCA